MKVINISVIALMALVIIIEFSYVSETTLAWILIIIALSIAMLAINNIINK